MKLFEITGVKSAARAKRYSFVSMSFGPDGFEVTPSRQTLSALIGGPNAFSWAGGLSYVGPLTQQVIERIRAINHADYYDPDYPEFDEDAKEYEAEAWAEITAVLQRFPLNASTVIFWGQEFGDMVTLVNAPAQEIKAGFSAFLQDFDGDVDDEGAVEPRSGWGGH